MTDLMTEMPQKGAVRLPPQGTFLLPVDIVGLGDIERNQSVVVTGEHALGVAVGVILEKFECQSLRLIVALRDHRQAQTEQGVQHAALGDLQAEPGEGIALGGKIGYYPVQPARTAEIAGIIGGYDPVAHAYLVVIRAQSIALRFGTLQLRSPESVRPLSQCRHEAAVGQERKRAAAVQTAHIFEEDHMLAMGTVKSFHWALCRGFAIVIESEGDRGEISRGTPTSDVSHFLHA